MLPLNARAAMEGVIGAQPEVGRFVSVLAGEASSRPFYDKPLLETHGCVITPTLGSIVPNWLLIIPRAQVMNFAQWRAAKDIQPFVLIQAVLAEFNIDARRAIWFEHGPSQKGVSLGCGVDHAHLHLIIDAPFSWQSFVSATTENSELTWQNKSPQTAHEAIEPTISYLLAASRDEAITTLNAESIGSQFFRRIIATLVQQSEAWNYRTHPHFHNIQKTINMFRNQNLVSCDHRTSL